MLKFASFLALLLLVAATRAEPLLGPSELEEQEDGELLIEDQLIEDQEDGEFLVEEQEDRELAYEDWVGNQRVQGYGIYYASLKPSFGRSSDYGPNDRYAPYPEERNERKPTGFLYSSLQSPIGRSSDYGPKESSPRAGNVRGQRFSERPGERASVYDSRGQRYSDYAPTTEQAGYRTGNMLRGSNDERYFDPVGFAFDVIGCTFGPVELALTCSETLVYCLGLCFTSQCVDNCKTADESTDCTFKVDSYKRQCFGL